MPSTSQILREKGLKVTPQRIAIYNMLMDTRKHPNAETIYKALVPDNPTMSLATVYKTLDFFKVIGLIQELNVGEGSARYDANPATHPHAVCTHCHQVSDLDLPTFSNLRKDVALLTDFILEREQLVFYGICPECQKKEASAKND